MCVCVCVCVMQSGERVNEIVLVMTLQRKKEDKENKEVGDDILTPQIHLKSPHHRFHYQSAPHKHQTHKTTQHNTTQHKITHHSASQSRS